MRVYGGLCVFKRLVISVFRVLGKALNLRPTHNPRGPNCKAASDQRPCRDIDNFVLFGAQSLPMCVVQGSITK